jgi:hypothetical protein
MNIARPANGFRIIERTRVLSVLANHTDHCPWLQRGYSDVKHKLRMAGHRVGEPVRNRVDQRVFIDVDPITDENRLAVYYSVLGDTLTMTAMLIIAASNPSTPG